MSTEIAQLSAYVNTIVLQMKNPFESLYEAVRINVINLSGLNYSQKNSVNDLTIILVDLFELLKSNIYHPKASIQIVIFIANCLDFMKRLFADNIIMGNQDTQLYTLLNTYHLMLTGLEAYGYIEEYYYAKKSELTEDLDNVNNPVNEEILNLNMDYLQIQNALISDFSSYIQKYYLTFNYDFRKLDTTNTFNFSIDSVFRNRFNQTIKRNFVTKIEDPMSSAFLVDLNNIKINSIGVHFVTNIFLQLAFLYKINFVDGGTAQVELDYISLSTLALDKPRNSNEVSFTIFQFLIQQIYNLNYAIAISNKNVDVVKYAYTRNMSTIV